MRIQTYGTLDEVNATFGVLLSETDLPQLTRTTLLRLQGELFQLGAELATPRGKNTSTALITAKHIHQLEAEIDHMQALLPPLKTFILPGGSRSASLAHLARTVSRRAERELVCLHRAEPVRPAVLQYVNRLSDTLFVIARYLNHQSNIHDTPWESVPEND
jgi:cob(I)alamin adenosyltransferase